MNHLRLLAKIPMLCLAIVFGSSSLLNAQMKEDTTVRESIGVLNEIMAIPASAIPKSMLADSYAVAIIPKVIKGSFVIGARHGRGVLMVRDQNTGGWHAPVFINLTGGNIGWQVGIQSTDVILVFKTPKSVSGLLNGKFTLGADAAIAAGPIGRQASAATDAQLGAEIYSWSRSRGLFLGVSLDGSVIEVDQMRNATYYRQTTPGGPVLVPEAAKQLTLQVTQYTGMHKPATVPNAGVPTQNASAAQPQPQQILAQQHARDEATHVRDELARFARELYEKLDPTWQSFLALPAEVFNGNGHPSIQQLNQSLSRFETIRTDARYSALANDAEFQSTYGLLKHYTQELSNNNKSLNLPAPPIQQ